MRFYFLNTETYKIQFTEPTETEIRRVNTLTRWNKKAKYGVLLSENEDKRMGSERKIDLYWTLESNEDLIKREYLFEL